MHLKKESAPACAQLTSYARIALKTPEKFKIITFIITDTNKFHAHLATYRKKGGYYEQNE